jgi:DNA-binding MarR family transcriptional regulator
MKQAEYPLSATRPGKAKANGADGSPATIRELLSFKLHVVANLLSRGAALRYKREFGVSLMEWRTLALLGGGAPLSLNELAKLAGLDKSQMSRVVAGLTERGLILRAVDSEDARGLRLSLTASGRKVYAGLIEAANQRNDAFLAALDGKERQMLEGVLDKLSGAAREFIHSEVAADEPARKAAASGAKASKAAAARGSAAKAVKSGTKEKRSSK